MMVNEWVGSSARHRFDAFWIDQSVIGTRWGYLSRAEPEHPFM
ncbi:MAG: hypothetical protein AB7S74_00480 [Hyphomicrobium sp.]